MSLYNHIPHSQTTMFGYFFSFHLERERGKIPRLYIN